MPQKFVLTWSTSSLIFWRIRKKKLCIVKNAWFDWNFHYVYDDHDKLTTDDKIGRPLIAQTIKYGLKTTCKSRPWSYLIILFIFTRSIKVILESPVDLTAIFRNSTSPSFITLHCALLYHVYRVSHFNYWKLQEEKRLDDIPMKNANLYYSW